MQELLQKVGARVGADGMEDPEVVDAALKEEITSATDRFFSPERRELVASHMRDSAISVRGRARVTTPPPACWQCRVLSKRPGSSPRRPARSPSGDLLPEGCGG